VKNNTLPEGPVLPASIRGLHGHALEVRTDQSDWTWDDESQRIVGLRALMYETTLEDTERSLCQKAWFELSRQIPDTKAGRPKKNADGTVQNTRDGFKQKHGLNGGDLKRLRWLARYDSYDEIQAELNKGKSFRQVIEEAKYKKTDEIKPSDAIGSSRAEHLIHILAGFCSKFRPERVAGLFSNRLAEAQALRNAGEIVIEWVTAFCDKLPTPPADA
jgi:hypothetical protein